MIKQNAVTSKRDVEAFVVVSTLFVHVVIQIRIRFNREWFNVTIGIVKWVFWRVRIILKFDCHFWRIVDFWIRYGFRVVEGTQIKRSYFFLAVLKQQEEPHMTEVSILLLQTFMVF